jgi:pimeloyl-ACP methyl ester carboxylesterase
MLPVENIVVNGIRSVVYDSAPAASEEAVVFVHGNPGPSDDWEVLAPRVARFARTIAMDLPGFGRAEHPYRFDFSVTGYSRYLGALLEQLGVRRAHLVLHDFGGPFGLTWAAHHLDQLASVTLINTGVLKGYRWHRFARIWQTPIIGELFQLMSSPGMMKRALDASNPQPMPREFIERIHGYADWPHLRTVLKLYRATRDADAELGRLLPADLQIDQPTCVIWGEGDSFLPARYAQAQRDVFRNAEVHVLPKLGHWPFVDDPATVGDLLSSFLQRHVTTAVAAE